MFDVWKNSQNLIGVFCDLSEVVDCVDHTSLTVKLKIYLVKEVASTLVQAYLSNRTHCVNINGGVSEGSFLKMGVQGSRPFLFLLSK